MEKIAEDAERPVDFRLGAPPSRVRESISLAVVRHGDTVTVMKITARGLDALERTEVLSGALGVSVAAQDCEMRDAGQSEESQENADRRTDPAAESV